MAEPFDDLEMNDLLFAIRADLEEQPHVREFFIFPKPDQNVIGPRHGYFVYYKNESPNFAQDIRRLLAEDLVVEVTEARNEPKYRITEKLADSLLDYR